MAQWRDRICVAVEKQRDVLRIIGPTPDCEHVGPVHVHKRDLYLQARRLCALCDILRRCRLISIYTGNAHIPVHR